MLSAISQNSYTDFDVWRRFAAALVSGCKQDFLEEMYRTFRKYGAGIASVTQNLADYGDEAFAKLIVTNSFNRILLQGAASTEVLERALQPRVHEASPGDSA